MKLDTPRLLAALLVITILGGLALHLVGGSLCLSARSASACQRCCQPDSSSETQVQVPACSLFCCTGLPGAPEVPIPPVLSLAVALPGIQDLSACLTPAPPPPKFSLSIQDRLL